MIFRLKTRSVRLKGTVTTLALCGVMVFAMACTKKAGRDNPLDPSGTNYIGPRPIAFVKKSSSKDSLIYRMNTDGSEQRTADADACDCSNNLRLHPAWTADGSKMIFSRAHSDSLPNSGWLERADFHGGNGESRAPLSCGCEPAVAPDGRIAIVTRDGGLDTDSFIWILSSFGDSTPTKITGSTPDDHDPTWSPSGSKLAFSRSGDIYTINPDGTGETMIMSSAGTDLMPAWSPDGNRIAFSSTRDGNSEIYLMNPDGSSLLRLTTNGAVDIHPAWSPDSNEIVFESYRDGNAEIYIMNKNGSGQKNLTNSGGDDIHPAWRP